ncbi:MAG: hypothetical protein II920_08885 [Clostridia bacterium]|nr:hypothetical protein [Clostridia bacterium]
MSGLFAGFDGGGSKTACVLCDESGLILGEGSGGASNFRYCGEDTARRSMSDALMNAFASAGLEKDKLSCAYVSNATIPTYGGEEYVSFFESCVDAEKLICEGDLYPIWYGEAGDSPAVVCIAGTGSVAYLFRDKTTVRAGGWGQFIGDEGSGYDIGMQSLRTLMRMYDGRLAKDETFIRTVSPQSELRMLGRFYSSSTRSDIAALAGKVMRLAEEGNRTALTLTGRAADELVALVKAVTDRDAHEDRLPLILTGGLMYENSPLLKLVSERTRVLCSRICDIRRASHKPAVIAAALALKASGHEIAAERLLERGKSAC